MKAVLVGLSRIEDLPEDGRVSITDQCSGVARINGNPYVITPTLLAGQSSDDIKSELCQMVDHLFEAPFAAGPVRQG